MLLLMKKKHRYMRFFNDKHSFFFTVIVKKRDELIRYLAENKCSAAPLGLFTHLHQNKVCILGIITNCDPLSIIWCNIVGNRLIQISVDSM